ncbi:MAG: hypothetical protein HKO79_09760 [Desulfobacterales bacterium]|nr:hypothetical protein [Deltaproteobacteria bacterium]NNL42765.1 hypothetical protein [Desulfobacterales bacterium]
MAKKPHKSEIHTLIKLDLKKIVVISLAILFLFGLQPLGAIQLENFPDTELTIRFEPSLKGVAHDVLDMYPQVRLNLKKIFGWEMPSKPTVFLIQDSEYFQQLTNNKFIVAFAVPAENLIVINCSTLYIRPHRVDHILKHEMIHLILHHHIKAVHLPRWLDEGVAQWLSEGVGELLEAPQRSFLEEAMLSGKFIPLKNLKYRFPADKNNLMLAYEESRSFVTFISERYGDKKIFEILQQMHKGNDIHTAFYASMDASLVEVENRWIAEQRRQSTWFVFLAGHIYEFLFFAAALLTVIGFIRFLIKKRNYTDDDD